MKGRCQCQCQCRWEEVVATATEEEVDFLVVDLVEGHLRVSQNPSRNHSNKAKVNLEIILEEDLDDVNEGISIIPEHLHATDLLVKIPVYVIKCF
ncbi:hypothetical protein NECAME_01079, partial [Necator americanus]